MVGERPIDGPAVTRLRVVESVANLVFQDVVGISSYDVEVVPPVPEEIQKRLLPFR